MAYAAQWWLVHRLTEEPIWLGIVGTAHFLPVFLFSFVAGAVADRFPKRALLVATQSTAAVLALILAILTFAEVITVYHIVVLALLLGTVFALDMPTRQSFVIEMVGQEDVLNAVALNSSIFNGARVVGPAIAGVVIAASSEAVCFLVNSISFLAVITGLLLMRLHPLPRPKRRAIHHEIAEGFRFVRQTIVVQRFLLAAGISSIFGMSYQILLPVFADTILGQGPRGYGVLVGSLGLGAVAGALRLAGRTSTGGSGRRVATGMGLFGLALFSFSFSRIYILSAALLVVAGAAMITQLATTNTFLQRTSPDSIRGRVLSMYIFIFVGMAPIGTFLAGALAQRIGAPWAIRIGGAVCMAGALWFAGRLRQVREPVPSIGTS
jgi:MFS family permease